MMKKASFFSALSFFAAASVSQGAAVHAGLLSYWNLDGNANDSAGGISGNTSSVADNGSFDGTNGTGGISYAAGLFGQGTLQDGAVGAAQDNGFVRVPQSADTLRGGLDLSLSVWFRVDGFDTNWQTLVSHGEGAQYRVARQNNGDGIAYAGGNGDHPNPSPTSVNDATWHHVVVTTANGGATEIFLDGSLYSTNAAAATLTNNGNNGAPGGAMPDFYIGANPQTGGQNREWFGGIDDLGTWGRVITPEEVDQIYTAGRQGVSLGQIPEPGISALIGLAGFGLLLRRRR